MEIYLDNCATTKVCDEAAAAVMEAMTTQYGNPSSLHLKGLESEQLLTAARKRVAALLGCEPEAVYFTANATESNNIALLGAAKANPRAGRTLVITGVEHSSVEEAAGELARQGYTVRQVLPREDMNFYPEDFLAAVDEDTFLLSFMMVNNETGTLLPYEKVVPLLKRRYPRLLIHMDAVQGVTKYPINLKRLPLDFLSFSGHKLYAPKGIGVLFVRKGVRVSPLVFGGGQEKGLRSGTQAVQLAAGLSAALSVCMKEREESLQKAAAMNKALREGLAALPEVYINSPENGVPYILNFSVPGIPSEILLHFLETKGIFLSSGSACSKGALSGVLARFGLPPERVKSALRVSFGRYNQPEDVEALLAALGEAIGKFRKIVG